MRKKHKIKWYYTIESLNSIDNYNKYVYSVNQPDCGWRPVNPKYFREKSRFLKN